MRNQISRTKIVAALLAVTAVVIAGSIVLSGGCTKRLDGEVTANQKPIVYFVNVPPEGQRFSRNPVIHWVGTDRDGLIAYFRYHVATGADLGGLDPLDYIQTVPPEDWIRLDVDPKGPDPMTSNIVSMSANLTDPVLTYVVQYVFLQAFDEEGLGSDIAYRIFSRNDNPPTSFVLGFAPGTTPFVNSVTPGGIITGVKLRWIGDDPIDYPSDPPPFEFDWRLYGPYSDEELAVLQDSFMDSVYVTTDGGVYRMGDTVIRCDTFYVDTAGNDQVELIEECDTLVVSHSTPQSAFGGLEAFFRVDDPDFVGSPYDRVQQRSDGWVTETSDTLWNVFSNYHSDTTIEMQFVFWLRSRDDAKVPDLVPFYRTFPVIDPRYERDVAIIDFSKPTPAGVNDPISRDTAKAYWKTTISRWADNTGREIVFDTTTIREGPLARYDVSPDYIYMGKLSPNPAPIAELLKHKVMIIYDDVMGKPEDDQWATVYKSIDAGINAWVTARTIVRSARDNLDVTEDVPMYEYRFYFGVESVAYTGWLGHVDSIGTLSPKGNFQDFVGTFAINPDQWPDLAIDSALLHRRYKWYLFPQYQRIPYWNADCPGLPEVGWSVRSYGTDVIYLYKSCYGNTHPLGGQYIFQGDPVAHRLTTSLFKTVHFNFTPLAMDTTTMQVVVDSVLNYLYDPTLGTSTSQAVRENRYPEAKVKVSLSEARRNYEKRCEDYAKRHEEAITIE